MSRCIFWNNVKNNMIRLPVFYYHHVSNSVQKNYSPKFCISPDFFEKQMFLLYKKGFQCLSLSEVVSSLVLNRAIPTHSFALTFDDGYDDTFEFVFLVLKKYGFFATIFVIAKSVNDNNRCYLSWKELSELVYHGFSIGSHTSNHSKLTSLNNRTIKFELQESKKIIEDRLDLPVTLFAYPFGDFNERVKRIVRESGYLGACGIGRGQWSLYNLWRIPVYENDSKLTFYFKVYGVYNFKTWLREETILGKIIRKLKGKSG